MLSGEKKQEVIREFAHHATDVGSTQVQIAVLTKEIEELKHHFDVHTHDLNSKRGMLKKVNQRQKLLRYLKQQDETAYQSLIQRLGLRK